jgi:hypothetical protein
MSQPDPLRRFPDWLQTNLERPPTPKIGPGAGKRQRTVSPNYLPSLTRPQLCGRITALRAALDTLASQADADRLGAFQATGSLKVELIALESHLRALDTPARWPHGALRSPEATRRLRTASADLQEVMSEIKADAIRAAHRAAGIAETAWIREMAELNRVPTDELLELAPSLARELYQERGSE